MRKKFKPAFNGICIALKDKSICIQLVLGLITLFVSVLIMHATVLEMLFIISAVTSVVLAEMFNTCIEKLFGFKSFYLNVYHNLIVDAHTVSCKYALGDLVNESKIYRTNKGYKIKI